MRQVERNVPRLIDCDDVKIRAALDTPATGLHDGTRLYPTLTLQAAVLLYHVVKSHACLDGNKRIAATLMLVFLRLNGLAPFFSGDELVALTTFAADSAPSNRSSVLDRLQSWITDRTRLALPGDTGTRRPN